MAILWQLHFKQMKVMQEWWIWEGGLENIQKHDSWYHVCTKLPIKIHAKSKPTSLRRNKKALKICEGNYRLWNKFSTLSKPKSSWLYNSDSAGSQDDMRSTPGYTFTLGNGVFSWLSRKQDTLSQSTAEAEYIVDCKAVNQAIWLRKIMTDVGETQESRRSYYHLLW